PHPVSGTIRPPFHRNACRAPALSIGTYGNPRPHWRQWCAKVSLSLNADRPGDLKAGSCAYHARYQAECQPDQKPSASRFHSSPFVWSILVKLRLGQTKELPRKWVNPKPLGAKLKNCSNPNGRYVRASCKASGERLCNLQFAGRDL